MVQSRYLKIAMPSSSRSLSLTVVLILSCLLAAGCAQVAKSLGELSRLHAEIVKEYGEKDVVVNLNNTSLSITFINSPLNAKAPEERAKRAEQAAAFVSRHYPSIDQIEEIWVGFVRQETRFIVVHYSEGLDVFGFDKNGHPLSRPEEGLTTGKSDSSIRPMAIYSPRLKETDVRITRLQLEGDLNYGLAVAPHFTVPGDATGVRRSSSLPRAVSFDFASYSEKSMFPGEPKITVLADGKVVFETSAQFSTSKSPEGKFSEFLLLQIPYPAFRRMTAGKTLTLRLGDREYRLTDEQVEALREMKQYVGE
jgi:hypothetical protein